jgi:RND family efflux transporter MFP subunit
MAELNVKKAQDAYDYTTDNLKRVEALYNGGGIPENELDKVKLDMDIRESEFKQAEEVLKQVRRGAREEDKEVLLHQLEQAKADYDFKKSLLEDAAINSQAEGFVVDVLYEEGEMVSAGYPAIVVRDESLVANVGLAERDFLKVSHGTAARVRVSGIEAEGAVTNISQSPDNQSRTYNIEIALKRNDFNLGSIAKVDINAGSEKGIWVPITSMLSDGIDYVYLAKDGIAVKREINIESTNGARARVKGLNPGESLIIEGMKRLNTGDRIQVLK